MPLAKATSSARRLVDLREWLDVSVFGSVQRRHELPAQVEPFQPLGIAGKIPIHGDAPRFRGFDGRCRNMPLRFIVRKFLEIAGDLDNRPDLVAALSRISRVRDVVTKSIPGPVLEATLGKYVGIDLKDHHVAPFRRQAIVEQTAAQIVFDPRFRWILPQPIQHRVPIADRRFRPVIFGLNGDERRYDTSLRQRCSQKIGDCRLIRLTFALRLRFARLIAPVQGRLLFLHPARVETDCGRSLLAATLPASFSGAA